MNKEINLSDSEIFEVLKIILDKIIGKSVTWRLEGSANLRIQGVDVSVRDIDITTNADGISIYRKALKDYLKKNFYNKKIRAHSLLFLIRNIEVEINAYDDEKLNFFDEIKRILWRELELPALPLEQAKEFYKLINREEKVALIENYLKNSKN